MPQLAGFSYDEIGLHVGHSAVREWRLLTAIEIAPPLWSAARGWDVTFFFTTGEPMALASGCDWLGRERVEELTALVRTALAAAPAGVAVSPLARALSGGASTLPPVRREMDVARCGRDARGAWQAWSRWRAERPDDPETSVLALTIAEETGRCPAELREAWAADLRRAMRDPVTLEKVARLYLATNDEMAEPYARLVLKGAAKSPVIVRALARWLIRRGRIAEAGEAMADFTKDTAVRPAETWGLAADRLALERYRQRPRERWRAHGRRRLCWLGGTLVAATAVTVAAFSLWYAREQRTERTRQFAQDAAERTRRASALWQPGTREERQRFAELKVKAAAGDVPAMFELSRHYRIGRTTEFDAAMERLWLERAAEAGHVEAQVTLAGFLRQGRGGTPVETQKAFAWYERAADKGNVEARRQIIRELLRGKGMPPDQPRALRLTEELSATGDMWAATELALLKLHDPSVTKDESAGMAELKREAERGNPHAWAALGMRYDLGLGGEKDAAEALRCYENAVRAGHLESIAPLARQLRRRTRGAPDEPRVEELLRKAAAADHVLAQTGLASLLSMPARGTAGQREARYWGERAVHENYRSAMYSTAMFYLRARNPRPADISRGRQLLEMGANAGDTLAMNELARGLRDGKFGLRDGAGALRWWHKAAEANSAPAMLELATVYEEGNAAAGIYKDVGEARRFLEKAATLGSAEAKKRLAALPADPAIPAVKKWTPPADLLENLPVEGPPKVVHQTLPRYPFEMRRQNVSGEVVVDFVVAKDGSVQNAYAIKSSRPEFAANAVATVSEWHFRPGTKDGQPVDTHMQVPVMFRMQDEPKSAKQ